MRCYGDMDMLVLINSAVSHIETRKLIRETWLKKQHFGVLNIGHVFIVGYPEGVDLREKIEQEHAKYGDLMVGNLKESYRNNTARMMLSFKWIAKYCTNVRYLLKVEDHVVIFPRRLLRQIRLLAMSNYNTTAFVLGKVRKAGARAIRMNTHRNYVSKKEYSEPSYPMYCYGFAFVMSNNLIPKILAKATRTPPIPLEDIYLGVLLHKIGVKPIDSSSFCKRPAEYETSELKHCAAVHDSTATVQSISKLWYRGITD
ncbi:UDP-GalNAc:beta-1,3-N-acetylgalactosaminyltransferase 1-like [Glandiceps talaboti]